MLTQQLELTYEQTSPLFRIMMIHNINEPHRRHYDNNVCAFHIGKGYVLTVAHSLRSEAQIIKSIDESIFSTEIRPHLNADQLQLFNQRFHFDSDTNKRYISVVNPNDVKPIIDILKQINFDTRWINLMQRNICSPHLIVQFKNNKFYNNPNLDTYFNVNTKFFEPSLSRNTFLLEVQLVEAFYNEDIALYKIINTHQDIIDALPSIEIDFSILNTDQEQFYCLQSSPNSEVGKLLNKAHIEGYLEHFGVFPDHFGGNYIFEGMRYLIKGYFRFGSSGAPYVFYDNSSNKFKVNAIQSEACPLQLSIDNKREGNFQYVNAIASPLFIVKDKILKLMDNANF